VQLVIFLPTFNAPCIRPKIRCDSYYAKIFGSFWYLNRPYEGKSMGQLYYLIALGAARLQQPILALTSKAVFNRF
jgi:hypothetical protein